MEELPRFEKTLSFFARLFREYFRVTWTGLENVPKEKGVLIAANHSGFAGTDAIVLSHLLGQHINRPVYILAHWTFFKTFSWLKVIAIRRGLIETSVNKAVDLLKKGNTVIIFPEGEAGNFKPSSKKYQLQQFHTGAVRIALEAGVPLVPVVVLGAEESHINLADFRIRWFFRRVVHIPLPLNAIPLPVKWKIVFGSPFDLVELRRITKNKREFVRSETRRLRRLMQELIVEELRVRPYVFSKKIDEKLRRYPRLAKLVQTKNLF